MNRPHTLLPMVAVLIAAWVAVPASAQQSSLQCEQCHGELELLRQRVQSLDRARGLLVPPGQLRASAHGELPCSECHTGFGRFPHSGAAITETCASCHQEAAEAWRGGIHAGADGQAVPCAECHGVHDVVDPAEMDGGPGLVAMNATCAACHETQRLVPQDPHSGEAGCWTCHAPHEVDPPAEPTSWMSERNQPQVCGACHDSIASRWSEDVHGRALLGPPRPVEAGGVSAEPPTCSSCHGSHPIVTAGTRDFSEAAVERCIGCHEMAGATFFGSYHGKATAVGSEVAATCVDCHGAHGIQPADDPRSAVAEANLVETCSACHEYARPAFVQYDAHPQPLNSDRNPWIFWAFVFMNTMLVGTLVVFGAHTVAWWIRSSIDRRRGVPPHGARAEGEGAAP